MEVVDRYGLALALVAPHELDDAPWRRAGPPLDVVRLTDPPAAAWSALAAHGFVLKPRTVSWVAELGPDEDAYLGRLRRPSRRDLRRSQRDAVAAGLREVVEEPVTPQTLDAFLTLYADRVAAMRFGVPFALGHRESVLDGPEKFYGVFAYEATGELAGGCLVREQPGQDAAVIRFSAVTERRRRSSLARVLYLTAMRVARDKGFRCMTLGNEPNLVGHLTRPGLFLFKAHFGFEAIPSQWFGDPDGGDEADLVLRLTALDDPTLILGYTAGAGAGAGASAGPGDRATEGPVLACHLYGSGDVADDRRYTAPFLAPTVPHRVTTTPREA